MKNGITYNGRSYSHRQYWRLIRDLTANGWTVTICAQEDRREANGSGDAFAVIEKEGSELTMQDAVDCSDRERLASLSANADDTVPTPNRSLVDPCYDGKTHKWRTLYEPPLNLPVRWCQKCGKRVKPIPRLNRQKEARLGGLATKDNRRRDEN